MPDVAVLVLAAGKGERMRSDRPKVLHSLAGRPLLFSVIQTAQKLHPKRLVVLVGHQAERVRKEFNDQKITWALQKRQLGTAHAVLCGLEALRGYRGLLFILHGDVPLLKIQTLIRMKEILAEENPSLILLTTSLQDPSGYGRVIRNESGDVLRIVEEKDAEDWEKESREINSGIYLARVEDLLTPLRQVKKNIVKGEYYLTSLVETLVQSGKKVLSVPVENPEEVMGINSQRELSRADEVLQREIREGWMERGVTFIHPQSIRIERDVVLESGVVLHPGVVLIGNTKIRHGAEILPYSVIEESVVGENARVGPFAHLRPGSVVGSLAHVGNFVELKKSRLGSRSKANHLTYLGDAVVGDGANIGAGTITCNYDGFGKYKTTIGEGAFIGSNTQLVAPVKIGKRAFVAAGTTVTKNVPPRSLALSRVEQKNVLNWGKRRK